MQSRFLIFGLVVGVAACGGDASPAPDTRDTGGRVRWTRGRTRHSSTGVTMLQATHFPTRAAGQSPLSQTRAPRLPTRLC